MNKNGIGKLILIGINYYNENNELLEQYQTSGIIESITENEIKIKRENHKELFTIPNDDRAIIEAKPGEYKERQSGKIIKNPDFISQWIINGTGSKKNIERYKEKGFEL